MISTNYKQMPWQKIGHPKVTLLVLFKNWFTFKNERLQQEEKTNGSWTLLWLIRPLSLNFFRYIFYIVCIYKKSPVGQVVLKPWCLMRSTFFQHACFLSILSNEEADLLVNINCRQNIINAIEYNQQQEDPFKFEIIFNQFWFLFILTRWYNF